VTARPGGSLTRDALVKALEGQKVQTRMLFAGNLVRQPAMTELKRSAAAAGRPAPYRVVGELPNTDTIMNRTLWWGVYPGLTEPMRQHVVATVRRVCGR
jgi:CDP-6-deoxy-D-xylo-4-hexulose-3-dehydrase